MKHGCLFIRFLCHTDSVLRIHVNRIITDLPFGFKCSSVDIVKDYLPEWINALDRLYGFNFSLSTIILVTGSKVISMTMLIH